MKLTRLHSSLILLAGGLLSAVSSYAGPVTLPFDAWQTEPFTSMNPGDMFPTVYIASQAGTVDITGYYVTGDYYNVDVNGSLVLTTTQVPPLNVDYGDQTPSLYADPASAFSSGLFSTGQFSVNTGDFISIFDLYPPGGIGEVGLNLVPEPSAFALLGMAGIGALLLRVRRSGDRDRPVLHC